MSFNLSYTAQDLNNAVTRANAAAPQATTYTKSEVDTALSAKANSADLGTAASKNMDSALNASSTNPVQNSTLSEKFSEVDTTLDLFHLMLNTALYGFRINKQNSNPETRVEYLYDAVGMTPARMNYTTGQFDYGDWANAWFIRENKPCALRYNGTVAYYLNPNDYTLKEDGTASDVSNPNFEGNFMAQLPTIWVKRWEDESYIYVALSNKQLDSDFKAYAHDAGDGYVNDYIYLPMFKGVVVDSKLRSIAGVTPQGSTTGSAEKTAAEACGSGWQTWDWSKHCIISDLLTLISRSTNSQATFGKGDVNTYDSSDTTTYGKLTTGTSGAGQFWGTNDEVHHVKVFHIEDFWGNRSERCLGLHLVDNEYVYRLVRPYSTTPDSTYISSGKQAPVQGMIKNASIGEFGFLPTETGGTGATYFCDALVPSASGTRLLRFGSACNASPTTGAGDRNYNLNAAANDTQWYIGASPVYNAPHSGYDDKVDEDVFDYVQPQIDTIREILGVELYGFRIDKQDSNPATRVTYMYDAAGKAPAHMDYTSGTFDYGDWANAWFVRENKPCALKYDGTVDYYLNPNDYTKKADGTASDVSDSSYAGNFMASMPTVWVKRWEDSRYIYTAISNKQINESYHAYAHDAGDGFINDFIYLPMFKGSVTDSKLRSIAGTYPSTATTVSADKTAAEACGAGWQLWDWSKHCLITDLLTLISRTTDSQTAFGGGDADTLGEAPTYGMLMTGTSGGGQFYGTDDYTHHVKVFHIEDYWGSRYETCLGLNLVNGNYMLKAVRPYSVDGDSTYTNVGAAPTNSSWIKSLSVNEQGWLPSETGASLSTYYCDWVTVGDAATNCIARAGGMNTGINGCGAYFLYISRSAAAVYWFLGSSAVYNPPHSA